MGDMPDSCRYAKLEDENSRIKKAIHHFKYGVDCDIFSEPVTSYAKTAISALEKQMPKKPIKTPDNHKWFCPTCHNPIRLGRNHCCNCGQKIGYGSDTE